MDWIKNLKPGDEVAILLGGYGTQYRIAKVKTITPTGIIKTTHRLNSTDVTLQFSPEGWEKGGRTHRDSLFEDIEKAKNHILHKKLYNRVTAREKFLEHASPDQLSRINAILDEIEGKKEVK